MRAQDLVAELKERRYDFSAQAAERKRAILEALASKRLSSADAVFFLHEELCFLRAYPPDAGLRALSGRLLAHFDERADLRRFAKRLTDSGIAGTATDFRFYWLTAAWLAQQGWSNQLTIDWGAFENRDSLPGLLSHLMPFSETPALDSLDLEPQEWIDTLKRDDETDAGFLLRRFEALRVPTPLREKLYEDLDIPLRLHPGPTTPARGRDEWPGARVVYPENPPEKSRPDLKKAIRAATFRETRLDRREARRLVDLANRCMVPRHRDLLVFLYADVDDARLVDFGDGLQFFCVGAIPERRLLLESVYGLLTLQNGVPTGYLACSTFLGSAEVAYTVFETFRGRGAAHTYARVLALVHGLFGSDTFMIDPYQLGHDNDDGIESGAWWFYYKLGFRPHDAGVKRLVREERARMKDDPRHRTSRARLRELAREPMFLHLGQPRTDVLGRLSLGDIGLRIVERLKARAGADRERGLRELAQEVAARLGQNLAQLTRGERLAWERWAPLVDALPGVDGWSAAEKRALAAVVRAKGGASEARYGALLDHHEKLRHALAELAR